MPPPARRALSSRRDAARGARSRASGPQWITYRPGDAVPSDATHVRVHKCVEEIPKAAFRDHSHLREVQLPRGLRRIGTDAFKDCGRLECINLPRALEEIGDRAFCGCISLSLRDLALPEGLRKIGNFAFRGCPLRERIRFPSYFVEIGAYAFRGTSVRKVIMSGGFLNIGSNVFEERTVTVLPSAFFLRCLWRSDRFSFQLVHSEVMPFTNREIIVISINHLWLRDMEDMEEVMHHTRTIANDNTGNKLRAISQIHGLFACYELFWRARFADEAAVNAAVDEIVVIALNSLQSMERVGLANARRHIKTITSDNTGNKLRAISQIRGLFACYELFDVYAKVAAEFAAGASVDAAAEAAQFFKNLLDGDEDYIIQNVLSFI